jgi:hypothetical protein
MKALTRALLVTALMTIVGSAPISAQVELNLAKVPGYSFKVAFGR